MHKVRFIIPTRGDHDGLRMTYDSIKESCDKCEIVMVTENSTVKYKYEDVIVKECLVGTGFTEKINIGLNDVINRRTDAGVVCLLNDDVILFKGSVEKMLECYRSGYKGLLNPFSNCDYGWLHDIKTKIDNECIGTGLPLDWMTKHKYEVLKKCAGEIGYEEPVLVKHVAFYCTFIDSETVKELGYLDESMKTTNSDFEYCNRAKVRGFWVGWQPQSFIFHFGAVARKIEEEENSDGYQNQDKIDSAMYGAAKKRVLIYSGESWEKWGIDNLYKGGIGGSETCLLYLGRYLTRMGYEVVSVIDTLMETRWADGVKYISLEAMKDSESIDFNNIDVFISSRRPDMIAHFRGNNCKKILWCHDIRFGDSGIRAAGDFDHIVLLSDWHKRFWKQFRYDDKYVVIPNGIDTERFNREDVDYGRFVYGSSWDRGLDNLIYVLSEVKRRTNIDIKLDVYYGDHNLVKAINARGDESLKKFHEEVLKMINENPWVRLRGRVDQSTLAREYSRAFAWIYPTYFCETHCLTADEAMAAGMPIIHNGFAGLERLKDVGVLVNNSTQSIIFNDVDKRVFEPYIESIIELLGDSNLWKELSNASLLKAQQYAWPNIVKKWVELIEG